MDPKQLQEKIMAAVEACLAKGDYPNENAAIDAVITDLEAMKEKPSMKGLGEESEGGMKLPEEDMGSEDEEE